METMLLIQPLSLNVERLVYHRDFNLAGCIEDGSDCGFDISKDRDNRLRGEVQPVQN